MVPPIQVKPGLGEGTMPRNLTVKLLLRMTQYAAKSKSIRIEKDKTKIKKNKK